LEVWQKSSKICSEVYLYFRDFCDFGFKDQITRSALSIPSNSDKDIIRFLDIARASLAEVQTQIYIGMKIEYIDFDIGNKWIKEYDEISKMLSGLIRTIKNSK
jgi:four helix bundle protein